MQIPPSQLNLAASMVVPISGGRDAIRPGANASASHLVGVEHVDRSETSQDRDANEQYIGTRRGHGDHGDSQDPDSSSNDGRDLMKLDVGDDDAPPLLDIIG